MEFPQAVPVLAGGYFRILHSAPCHCVILGILFCLLALVMIIVTVVKTLCFGESVAGYPTIVCLVSLIGGLQLLCTGISGQYLSKMYLETKHRPRYIVKETEKSVKK